MSTTALLLLLSLAAAIAAFVLWFRKPQREPFVTRELTTEELNHVGLGSDGADEAIKRSES